MEKQRIAIIGLGRIGTAFLSQMIARQQRGIALVCMAEVHATPGRQLAADSGIPVKTLDEIVAMGEQIDVLFDLTGLPEVRRELRDKFMQAKNSRTIIASETIARVIWALITDDDLPVIAGRLTGY